MAWPSPKVLFGYASANAWRLSSLRSMKRTESWSYHSVDQPETQRLPSVCSGQDPGSTLLSEFGEGQMTRPLIAELISGS